MKIKKLLAKVLCASLVLSNLTIASASNVIINESPIDDIGIAAVKANSFSANATTETEWTTDESNITDVEVLYTQSSSYSVIIPKTVTLDSKKQATYSVKVTGDIDTSQRVYVAPMDGISDTESIDFYMKDQNSKKDDVVATVTQNKLYWSSEEVTNGYEETDNSISAPGLTSGTWKGTFQVEIKLQSEQAHEHNYIDGLCSCGAVDPNHTHTYVDGTCTLCGDKQHIHNYVDGVCACGEIDPNHEHNYTIVVTKEATCTEDGTSIYTCTICDDSHSETIPSIGHSFTDGKCTKCGEIDPNHTHNYVNGICTICNQQQQAGLYDANDNLLVSWAASKINSTCSNAATKINDTYPKTTKVVISNSVTSIGDQAFSECTSLTEVVIPNSVTSIGENVFFKCSSLTEVNIPNSVTSIGSRAFSNCTSLTDINIPDSVTSIGKATFCLTSLTDVVIPNSITELDHGVFQACKSLTKVILPDSITSISDYVFKDCTSLINIDIPNSVTSIGLYAFEGCTSLKSAIIGNSVTSIGNYAFSDCTLLTDLIIPDSVTKIGTWTFKNVPHITYNGTYTTNKPWGAKSIN